MAPEQFSGQGDRRADGSVRVLRRALRGALRRAAVRGRHGVIALADSVTGGRIKAPPEEHARFRIGCAHASFAGFASDPNLRYSEIDDLLAALANDPAKRTKQWALAGTALVAMLAVVGVTHRLGSDQRTMCTGGGAHFAGIWEPGAGRSERKAAIHRAFAASGKSYAEQAFTGVARLLDQYVCTMDGNVHRGLRGHARPRRAVGGGAGPAHGVPERASRQRARAQRRIRRGRREGRRERGQRRRGVAVHWTAAPTSACCAPWSSLPRTRRLASASTIFESSSTT